MTMEFGRRVGEGFRGGELFPDIAAHHPYSNNSPTIRNRFR